MLVTLPYKICEAKVINKLCAVLNFVLFFYFNFFRPINKEFELILFL